MFYNFADTAAQVLGNTAEKARVRAKSATQRGSKRMFKGELQKSQKQLQQLRGHASDNFKKLPPIDTYRVMEESGREMSTEEEVALFTEETKE